MREISLPFNLCHRELQYCSSTEQWWVKTKEGRQVDICECVVASSEQPPQVKREREREQRYFNEGMISSTIREKG